jgi:hypothetical protein
MSRLKNLRIGKPACFFLLSFVLVWQLAVSSLSDAERAKESFEAYIKALQQGDEGKAREFWNREETEKYKTYDWQWGYLIFRMLDPRHLNYRIMDAEETEGYVVLEVEWYYREGKAGRLQKDVRYFVEQDGKMVGANAILVHTKGWLQQESEHFVYHYKNHQDKPTPALLEEMDRFYEEVVDLLQVDYQDQIEYFKCESSEEVGLLFGLEASPARSQVFNGVVASTQGYVPHEIVHIISHRILPQDEKGIPPDYLNEGLAYYLGGASFFSPELLLSWAKKKLDADENVFLDSLIRDPWMYGKNEGAGLISYLAKVLIDAGGISRFQLVFTAGKGAEEQRRALRKIYGRTTDQLQREWREFVLSLPLPEITIVDPIRGREVFLLLDSLGDDSGDGDYVYPKNEKAPRGIFDLSGLRISLDDQVIYFQLQCDILNQAEIGSDEAFNGTFAVIAIDLDDKIKSGNTRLFLDNGNVEFSATDGYELALEVSNAGVLVYDKYWVWRLLFLEASSPQNHIRGNEIYFTLPREIFETEGAGPVDPVGWKFQVLTGGQKGGHVNTAYGVGKFMKVGEQSTQDQGGGGTNTKFSPDVYDIFTPQGADQAEILSGYDVTKKKKAVIPMIKVRHR